MICPHLQIRQGADTPPGASPIALLPCRRAFRNPGALCPHDADPLTAWRTHHDPTLHARVDRGSQLFEAGDFSGNIVGLDVDVYAAFMVHALDLHADLVFGRLEHHVIATRAGMIGIDGTPQRLCPEACGRLDIFGVAVDQYSVDARAVHVFLPLLSLSLLPMRT